MQDLECVLSIPAVGLSRIHTHKHNTYKQTSKHEHTHTLFTNTQHRDGATC